MPRSYVAAAGGNLLVARLGIVVALPHLGSLVGDVVFGVFAIYAYGHRFSAAEGNFDRAGSITLA